MANKIIHKHSSVIENGKAKLPSAEQLVYGELAVNNADGVETITIKNTANEIVEFKSNEYYNKEISNLDGEINELKTQVGGKAPKTHNHGTITLTGDVTGSGTITGSDEIKITATVANDSHSHGNYTTNTNFNAHTGTTGATGTTGHVKLVTGDLNGKKYTDGEAAAAAHTHNNYSVTDHKHVSADITDSISVASGITSTASSLTQGKAIYNYAAPKSHASTATTYGVATTDNYGHVKISNDIVENVASASGLTAGMGHSHKKLAYGSDIGSPTKPIYFSSGTPTACTSIDNSLISKTSGTSTLAWNNEVTLATIAGQTIKAKLPANPNTDTNTAHKHSVGVGLTCDNTTGTTSGTVTYALKTAGTGEIGGIKVAGTRSSAVTTTQGEITGTYYGVEIDSNGKAFVNAPTVTTGSTTTYGILKVKTGDLSDITSHTDSIAASYYHNHDKKYAASGHTHSDASETSKGVVKLVNSDLQGRTHINGEAAGLGHTHGQYADQYVVASALTDLDYRINAITRNAASGGSGITVNSTDLVLGSAVYEYAAKKSHATTATTYGLGTTANYGHVKISNDDVSTVATASGLAAGMDHYHSKTRISTSSANGYYPMLFVNATTSGDTAILIDSSTGTESTSAGIRYNPSDNTCYCSGGFFEASDERLKNFGGNISIDLDKLAQLPKKYFTWKHDKDGKVHIGTSAQELQKIYPELVDTLEDGTLIVSYDTLSVIALKGVDVLYEKYKSLEERLNKIEKMLG